MKSGICICTKKVFQDDIDVIKCEICALTMHYKCYYGNLNHKIENNEPLCVTCTVNKINPFEALEYIYLHPVLMPKKPDLKTGNISGNFTISEDIMKKIKSEGSYKIFLYCVMHETPFLTERNYVWPLGFDILFNKHKLKHINYEPIDITRFTKVDTNYVVFQYKQLDKDYILFVLGTKPVLPKELYNSIEHYRQYSPEECKLKICQMLECSGIEKENISLKCSFSAGIMETPVRGKKCQHINCFDLSNFLTYAKSTKRWKCPLCKNVTYFADLYVDTFIKGIIEEFKAGKKDFDSFSIFIDSLGIHIINLGNKTYQKIESKYSSQKINYFNNENVEKSAEDKNYSPNRRLNIRDIEMDLDKEVSQDDDNLAIDYEYKCFSKIVY